MAGCLLANVKLRRSTWYRKKVNQVCAEAKRVEAGSRVSWLNNSNDSGSWEPRIN